MLPRPNSDLQPFIFRYFRRRFLYAFTCHWNGEQHPRIKNQANCLFFGWHCSHAQCLLFDFQQRQGQLWAVLAPKNGTKGAFWEVPYVEALQLSVGSFKSAFNLLNLQCRFETWPVKLRTQIVVRTYVHLHITYDRVLRFPGIKVCQRCEEAKDVISL